MWHILATHTLLLVVREWGNRLVVCGEIMEGKDDITNEIFSSLIFGTKLLLITVLKTRSCPEDTLRHEMIRQWEYWDLNTIPLFELKLSTFV